MHPSHSPDKQPNINSPEPTIACSDEWQDFYQKLHAVHGVCTDHQLLALCSGIFVELGLTPLQEFMQEHISSSTWFHVSSTSHRYMYRDVWVHAWMHGCICMHASACMHLHACICMHAYAYMQLVARHASFAQWPCFSKHLRPPKNLRQD